MDRVWLRLAMRAHVGDLFSLDHLAAKAHLKHLKLKAALRVFAPLRKI